MARQREQIGRGETAVRAVVIVGAAAFLIGGVWAYLWPRGFFELVAQYPPYNPHLFHDLGAFQLGIAAALIGCLFWRDPLSVGLFGGAVGAVAHAVSHIMDRHLGGFATDPWTTGLLGVLLTGALVARLRANR